MPDTDSPKVSSVEEDLPIMVQQPEPEQTLLNRKWSCLGDHAIAAYVDGVLTKYRRAWVEFHLSGCQRCRLVVADVVKAQRESDQPPPPAQFIEKAVDLAGSRATHWRWIWVPVGALAGIALLAVLTIILRKPQHMVVISPPAPAAPVVAKSEPISAVRSAEPDIVRRPRTPELLPTILSPHANGVMNSARLQFSWRPVPHYRNYGVEIVKLDGDLVWEGQTDNSALELPSEVAVKEGAYFVFVTAYLEDGGMAKSAPLRFLVKR